MRFIASVVLAGLLLAGNALAARETPYVKDVSVTIIPSTDEPVPMQRGTVTATLVNAHPAPLTAWALDLIDSDGRPVSRDVVDYVDLPSESLPSRGERTVEAGWVSRGGLPGPKPVALVFRAGIDSAGRGVGDQDTVEWMLKTRASREEKRGSGQPKVEPRRSQDRRAQWLGAPGPARALLNWFGRWECLGIWSVELGI